MPHAAGPRACSRATSGVSPLRLLEALRARFPLSMHGVGLSIGSPQPLDYRHVALNDEALPETGLAVERSGTGLARSYAASLPAIASCSTSVTRCRVHVPTARPVVLKPETRDALLEAIAKARAWIDDLVEGRVNSLAEIASRERKVERHVRLLAPLAFVAPQLVSSIIEGAAPADVTVTGLANGLQFSWHLPLGSRVYLPR
jgi:Protein of unknown function (DUF692)